ncbi:MAG: DNA topoisomerase IB, partial [Burkholderiales bacterium]|nr:DNA topoisomerase IB [Phycisphaerae bacterium]
MEPQRPAGIRPDVKRSLRKANLSYTVDTAPGIRRVRRGKGFAFVQNSGKPVTDQATLARIRALVIPPAWEEVWICPSPNGHLQATGRDSRGRKQAKYHARFREVRDGHKYDHLLEFAAALPKIRRTVARHLRLPGMPREKVLAAIVSLLEKTLIRIGNEQYARDNKHYGLTTIRNQHVQVRGATLGFRFVGKTGVPHEICLESPQ